jgi:outer membrane protein assembly factor BamE
MVSDFEAFGFGHGVLSGLDFGIVELLHSSAIQTNHVVMVLPLVEFIHRFATFKMVATQYPGLLELGQNPVNSGQPDVGIFVEQLSKNIFCGHVPHHPALKYFQNFQTWQSGFQTVVFQFINLAHGVGVSCWWEKFHRQSSRYNERDHIGPHQNMTATPTLRASSRLLALALVVTGMAGCSGFSGGINRDAFRPYVAEVVQGNFMSKEQRLVLSPGLSRVQVREILGTPLVASLFHADRWDYAFSIQRQGVAPQDFRLAVHFKGDVLERIEGDELPSESEFALRLIKPRAVGKLPPLQASEEDLRKFKSTPEPAPSMPTAVALPRTYPPLEPASP